MKKLYRFILFSCVFIVGCQTFPDLSVPEHVDLNTYWKFKTGDDLQWKEPDFDDSKWDTIHVHTNWEKQGYENYNGYAWYRVKFMLPSVLKVNAFIKDSIKIVIGKINDAEQTYLNGKLLGQNNKTFPAKKNISTNRFELTPFIKNNRIYTISIKDSRLIWDKENCFAIRVFNKGRYGGLNNSHPTVRIADVKDYLLIDVNSTPFKTEKRSKISKTLWLSNKSSKHTLSGKYTIEIISEKDKKTAYQKSEDVLLRPGSIKAFTWQTHLDLSKVFLAKYTFMQKGALRDIQVIQEMPYFLTPPEKKEPVIHGPEMYMARPGSDFLYKIPTTGTEPLTFAVEKLPKGLSLDVVNGVISGAIETPGEYTVILKAENIYGIAEKWFSIRITDSTFFTPPLGWSSRFCSNGTVNEKNIKAAADFVIASGLVNHGWSYISIDNGWQAKDRNYQGILYENENFTEMKNLVEYIHNKGLMAGISSFSEPGKCNDTPGSPGYEYTDAQTWSNRGFDLLRYESCPNNKYDSINTEEYQKTYTAMRKALKDQKRDIVYGAYVDNIEIREQLESVDADILGISTESIHTWESICEFGFDMVNNYHLSPEGGGYDPGMLSLGVMNFQGQMKLGPLSVNEQYSQISLWSLLSAPLFFSCDPELMDEFSISLLTNDEVIAIQQDTYGKKTIKKIEKNELIVLVRELQSNKKVIGVFNLDKIKRKISLDWEELSIDGKYLVRDAWRQEDVGVYNNSFQVEVFPHGVKLYYLMKQD